jgi:hypothetical protein
MGRPFLIHPQAYCFCGCGELTHPDRRYLYGHNRKGTKNPNSWLCTKEGTEKIKLSITKEVIEKRATSFRKRYANGYINPMKGKKLSKETKEKISRNSARYWKGKDFSPEMREKLSVSGRIAQLKKIANDPDKWEEIYHRMGRNGSKASNRIRIKNSPYVWKDVGFLSKEERECAKTLLSEPIKGFNCHIEIGRYTIDFFPQVGDNFFVGSFVEYHRFVTFSKKKKYKNYSEYYKERKNLIENSKYKNASLFIISDPEELEELQNDNS